MPQLSPMMWVSSVFMVLWLLLMGVWMYSFIVMEDYIKTMFDYDSDYYNVKFNWMWW